jgi:hypothetical protein
LGQTLEQTTERTERGRAASRPTRRWQYSLASRPSRRKIRKGVLRDCQFPRSSSIVTGRRSVSLQAGERPRRGPRAERSGAATRPAPAQATRRTHPRVVALSALPVVHKLSHLRDLADLQRVCAPYALGSTLNLPGEVNAPRQLHPQVTRLPSVSRPANITTGASPCQTHHGRFRVQTIGGTIDA